jgi:aspartate carbamoyltransferase
VKDFTTIDFSRGEDLIRFFEKVEKWDFQPWEEVPKPLAGKTIALLFYEPSTRTRLSFESAAKKLGADVLVIENPQAFSSVAKGETFEDTVRVISQYADCIVLRHPSRGASKLASDYVDIPVINAGDGTGEHPTQALLDLYTIWEHWRRLDNLTGLIAGDLAHSRTVHSLVEGLNKFEGNHLWFFSPPHLRFPIVFLENLHVEEITHLDEVTNFGFDFAYWTRSQNERMSPEMARDVEPLFHSYSLDKEKFDSFASEHTLLMHPLPRVHELSTDLDDDPRSVYLTRQIKNGLLVRMALFAELLK